MVSGSSGTFLVQQPCSLVQLVKGWKRRSGWANGLESLPQARRGFGVAQPQRRETM